MQDVWWWIKEVYLPNLYLMTDDDSIDDAEKNEYIMDGSSYKLGPPVIRQLRAEWGIV